MPPGTPAIMQSQAFREASLRGEVRRAWAVIGVIALVALLVLQGYFSHTVDPRIRTVAVTGVAGLLILQVGALLIASWARRRSRPIPIWFIASTVFVESLIPSAMIFYHIRDGTLQPYPALTSPPILAYAIMLILTTLRLRPWLCILAGSIGAAGYGGILAYIVYSLGIARSTTGIPLVGYVNAALLIFISGIAAAWVAHELSTHMQAALNEAETRRRMAVIEQDLSVARTIQQALIPRASPDIPGYQIAGWNRPAEQTGGDYYDWQPMPDGTWIVTLADVSGHGIGPAMVTAACRAYVRASASSNPDLPSLTSRINKLLADDLPEGRFITMVSVLMRPGQDSVALLSAGHGPIVLYVGSSGDTREITPGDLPLAILPDQTYGPAQTFTLNPGDLLALITDGFVEWSRPDARGRNEPFGIDRLKDSLRRHASLPPEGLIRAITADVEAFAAGHPQQDDLTMVIIRRA